MLTSGVDSTQLNWRVWQFTDGALRFTSRGRFMGFEVWTPACFQGCIHIKILRNWKELTSA